MFVDTGVYSVQCLVCWFLFNLLICIIMAIVSSLAIGKSVKSAGNLTYKTVRGRCIASQRITSNSSNSLKQAAQRSVFSQTIQSMQLVLPWVNNFFEKSKYGSSRNAFMRLCHGRYLMGGLSGEIKEGVVPLIEGFVLGCSRSTEGKLTDDAAPFLSQGSMVCVLDEKTKLSKITIGENAYNVLEAVKSTYTFTTAPKASDVSLLVYGFVSELGGLPYSPLFINSDISDEKLSELESTYGFKVTVSRAASGDIVSGLSIETSEELPLGAGGSLFVIVPRVANKVPTVSGLFGHSLREIE